MYVLHQPIGARWRQKNNTPCLRLCCLFSRFFRFDVDANAISALHSRTHGGPAMPPTLPKPHKTHKGKSKQSVHELCREMVPQGQENHSPDEIVDGVTRAIGHFCLFYAGCCLETAPPPTAASTSRCFCRRFLHLKASTGAAFAD